MAEYGTLVESASINVKKNFPVRSKSNFHGRNESIQYVTDHQKSENAKTNNVRKIRALQSHSNLQRSKPETPLASTRKSNGPHSMLKNFQNVIHTNRSGIKTQQQKKRRLNSFLNGNGYGSLPNQMETYETIQNNNNTITKTNSLPVNNGLMEISDTKSNNKREFSIRDTIKKYNTKVNS